MANILVAYATNSGTTEEVAKVVSEELTKTGAQATVHQVTEITSLDGFDAVMKELSMI